MSKVSIKINIEIQSSKNKEWWNRHENEKHSVDKYRRDSGDIYRRDSVNKIAANSNKTAKVSIN